MNLFLLAFSWHRLWASEIAIRVNSVVNHIHIYTHQWNVQTQWYQLFGFDRYMLWHKHILTTSHNTQSYTDILDHTHVHARARVTNETRFILKLKSHICPVSCIQIGLSFMCVCVWNRTWTCACVCAPEWNLDRPFRMLSWGIKCMFWFSSVRKTKIKVKVIAGMYVLMRNAVRLNHFGICVVRWLWTFAVDGFFVPTLKT